MGEHFRKGLPPRFTVQESSTHLVNGVWESIELENLIQYTPKNYIPEQSALSTFSPFFE